MLVTDGIYSKIRNPMCLVFIPWLPGLPIFMQPLFTLVSARLWVPQILYWKNTEEKALEKRCSEYEKYEANMVLARFRDGVEVELRILRRLSPSCLRTLYVDLEHHPHRKADEETERGHAQADDSHLSETLAERLVLGDRDIVAEQQDHTHC